MARARLLKKRITAVRTIQRITRTMQMIATSKFTKAQHRARAGKPYAEKIRALVQDALAAAPGFTHPLIAGPPGTARRERLLVISSDRGLCGAYNASVFRTAMEEVRRLRGAGAEPEIETAGKKAVGFFRFQKIAIAHRHSFGDQPGYEPIEELAGRYIADFAAGGLDAVCVASMQFVSNTQQVPRLIRLLPVEAAPPSEPGGAAGPRPLYEFSPSMAAILEELLPLAVKSTLFQAFLDGAVSEQIMRMVAMKAATENARELGKLLNRRFNRARQTQITTELMEVVGGAGALG